MEKFYSVMSGWADNTQRSDLLTLKSNLLLPYSVPLIKKQITE